MVSGFGSIKFIGLNNFLKLLRDDGFVSSFKNNLLFAFITIPIQLTFGFLLAYIINHYCYAKNLFKLIYFLPYISSIVAIASVWRFLLQPSFGPVNSFLMSIGISEPPKWLADTRWSLLSIALMYSWQNISFDMIIYLAGLQTVPRDLYEAADIDGVSGFQKITLITLPLIAPTTFFLLIVEIMSSFRVFDQIQFLTQGGPGNSSSVLVYHLYRMSFRYYRFGYGSSIALIMFVLIFVITYFYWQSRKRWSEITL